MLTLSAVREWLKMVFKADHYYIGKLDSKQDKSIGVYSLKRSGSPITAIDRLSSYDIKSVSILLHWNKNADETERTALSLFESIRKLSDFTIGNTKVYYLKLLVPEPVAVGTDDKGVYEYVIEFELYYERND